MRQILRKIVVSLFAFFARSYLHQQKPYIIGVTGSVGKTSCRVIIHGVIQKLLPQEYVYTSKKNYNSELGLSLSILGIDDYDTSFTSVLSALLKAVYRVVVGEKGPSIMVLEYGIDKPNDMDELLSICKPDVGVLTSIDAVHGSNFPDGTLGIYNEKIKLIKASKDLVFVNKSITFFNQDGLTSSVFFFNDNEEIGNDALTDYKVFSSGSRIRTSFLCSVGQDIDGIDNKIAVSTNIIGYYNISYIYIAIIMSDILGHRKSYPSLFLQDAISVDIALQPGRFSLFYGLHNAIILDSTYNASPSSMRSVIVEGDHIRKKFFSDYRLLCLIGEMREIGETSIQEHMNLGEWLYDKTDAIIGVSGDSVYVTDHFLGKKNPEKYIKRFDTNLNAIQSIQDLLQDESKKYFIIAKSSQGEIFLEETLKPFLDKTLRANLPRQEGFWIQKKNFLHKLYQ